MALINYEIEPRSFENIRDQVGLILYTELLNQTAITYDELPETNVFIQ
jgi:hypothetical protein